MCNNTLSPLPPPSRCGSVVLDFMMKFNQSVIVGNVLTFLSDSARQDKFGAFKVDPDSIKQVLIPTDGLESTTQGKYYNGVWMVFLTFQKCLKVSILLKMMNFFCMYSESIFFKQPFLWERDKVWAKFDISSSRFVVVFILLNKIWFLKIS